MFGSFGGAGGITSGGISGDWRSGAGPSGDGEGLGEGAALGFPGWPGLISIVLMLGLFARVVPSRSGANCWAVIRVAVATCHSTGQLRATRPLASECAAQALDAGVSLFDVQVLLLGDRMQIDR